jgi:hypothetical protein
MTFPRCTEIVIYAYYVICVIHILNYVMITKMFQNKDVIILSNKLLHSECFRMQPQKCSDNRCINLKDHIL